MKKKKIDLNKKLFLDKETISDLSKVSGGGPNGQSDQTCIFQTGLNGPCGPCTNPTLPPTNQTQDYPDTRICQTGIVDCGG